MKISKKLLAGLIVLSLIGAAFATIPVLAGTEASVSATVTPKNISVSVAPSSVAYGTVLLNTEAAPTGDPVITATNDGSVTENFNIVGADATYSTNTWDIDPLANGADIYMHKFAVGPGYSSYNGLDELPTYKTLATTVSASGTATFKLKIKTPISTTLYGQYSTTVTVQATE